jgi:hypothetical protein
LSLPIEIVSAVVNFNSSLKIKIKEDVMQYITTGTCRIQDSIVCINPTMFGSKCNNSTPFEAFLPFIEERFPNTGDGMFFYCKEVLRHFTSTFKERMGTCKFYFYMENPMKICMSNEMKFEVIHCSRELVEDMGLANLILVCRSKMTDTPSSSLFTEVVYTQQLENAIKYVEKWLCCHLNLIPTLFGMVLDNNIELRGSTRADPHPILCWHKAQSFQNVSNLNSKEFLKWQNSLAKLCFEDNPGVENFSRYTALTFYYAMDSMKQRIGDNNLLSIRTQQIEIADKFELARRTIIAWKNGQNILKLTSHINIKTKITDCDYSNSTEIKLLRLCFSMVQGPKQYVENFQFHENNRKVSFFLVENHGLEETKVISIEDFDRKATRVLFELDAFKDIHKELLTTPYPSFNSQHESSSVHPVSPVMQVKVESVEEFEDRYEVKIPGSNYLSKLTHNMIML